MTVRFKPATRSDSKPLIGLYGESGTGKTMSALLLARGLVGPSGRIAMIDTESGRGSLYADVIPGGYDVSELSEPFSPAAYVEAIRVAEEAEFDALVIDSMSHSWEGIGGVLDMAAAHEKRTGKPGLHCWKEPKAQHAKMMLKLLQSRLPIIVCLRAKHKSRQIRNKKTGKTEIVKDEFATPIQAEDFIFEMTAHAEVLQDHTLRITKCSHPDLLPCFPQGEPVTVETGAKISEWASGSSSGPGAARSEGAGDRFPRDDGDGNPSPDTAPPPSKFVIRTSHDTQRDYPSLDEWAQGFASAIDKYAEAGRLDKLMEYNEPVLNGLDQTYPDDVAIVRERARDQGWSG